MIVARGAETVQFRSLGVRGMEALFDLLQTKLRGRRVVPPTPGKMTPSLPAADDVETDDIGATFQSGDGVPLALFIEYCDSRGQVSRRRIACKRYEPATETILAYCFERRAARRFKVAQIRECVCAHTGEVLDIAAVIASLIKGGLPVRDERLGRLLTVLVFLMQCDNEENPLERDVIEDAAVAFALRFDGDDAMVEEGLRLALRIAPDADDFMRALRWMVSRPERAQLARLLDQFADRVIIADGHIASEEAYFGGILRDMLRQAMS